MYYSFKYLSPLGRLLLASDGDKLIGLWLEGQKYFAAGLQGEMAVNDKLPIFTAASYWLDAYFAGKQPAIAELPLAPIGSEFRQSVWHLLCKIPYGKLTAYSEMAKQLAKQQHKKSISAQAIGGAVAHNPIAIIIPCHRVIGKNGALTGYAGGMDKKIKLLELEGSLVTQSAGLLFKA